MGMSIAKTFKFTDYDTAIDLIRTTKKRYVYKSNGADSERTRNYVGKAEDGADLQQFCRIIKVSKREKLQ